MQRAGLEWLYRLCVEPRRLWRRYVVGNAIFCALVARQLLAGALRAGKRPQDGASGAGGVSRK